MLNILFTPMKHQLLSSIAIISFFVTCSSPRPSEQGEIQTVFFEKTCTVPPGDILDIAFLKIETADSCLLGAVSQIEATENLLLVMSNNKVMAFDRNGSFIAQIGQTGGGPDEYLTLTSFFVNEPEDEIGLIDNTNKKVLYYRLSDFRPVSTKKLGFSAPCASFLPDGNMLWHNWEYLPEGLSTDYCFVKTDTDLNVLDSYVQRNFKSGYITGDLINIYRAGGQVYAYTPFSPIIYSAPDGDMIPAFQLSFEGKQFPPVDFLKKESAGNTPYYDALARSGYISYFGVRASERDMCVFYIAKEERFIGLYDMIEKHTYHYSCDDFRKALKIGTGFTYVASGMIYGYHVIPLFTAELCEQKETGYPFPEPLATLINASNEEDNPILFLFKLKLK
jgi:hypothetical protein